MESRLRLQFQQEQTQKLIMTNELRQAITILQYSGQELSDFIRTQIEENPVLEVHDRYKHHSSKGSESLKDRIDSISQHSLSLEEMLLEQLAYVGINAKEQKIARYMIGLLDEDGYFREDLNQIAKEMNCDPATISRILSVIQRFEPAGIGAKDLEECLLIQLKAKKLYTPNHEAIIRHYLADMAKHRYGKIADALGVSIDEVKAMVENIRMLDPKPGRRIGKHEKQYIVPDVIVDYVNGKVVVQGNDPFIPELRINPYYVDILQNSQDDEQAKQFIEERIRKALWVIKSIEQRRQTILKVTEAIFQKQLHFFDKGAEGLQPLTLQDIATTVGIHESTVSRATNGKYVQTPRGVFELKYFFASRLSTDDGTDTSSESVKAKIRELLDREDKRNPLSDQRIAQLLNQSGIKISRRTIVKYREEMMIPSSVLRRRYS